MELQESTGNKIIYSQSAVFSRNFMKARAYQYHGLIHRSFNYVFWLKHHWSLGLDDLFHPTLYIGCNYISMLGLKLSHVS